MDSIIEIDPSEPCVTPRMQPDELMHSAIKQIAHNLISLEDAMRRGAELSCAKRQSLAGFVSMLNRLGAQ